MLEKISQVSGRDEFKNKEKPTIQPPGTETNPLNDHDETFSLSQGST